MPKRRKTAGRKDSAASNQSAMIPLVAEELHKRISAAERLFYTTEGLSESEARRRLLGALAARRIFESWLEAELIGVAEARKQIRLLAELAKAGPVLTEGQRYDSPFHVLRCRACPAPGFFGQRDE